MKTKQIHFIFIFLIGIMMMTGCKEQPQIIPLPAHFEKNRGALYLKDSITISLIKNDSKIDRLLIYFKNALKRISSLDVKVLSQGSEKKPIFVLNSNKPEFPMEGYQLKITRTGIVISARNDTGLFYGIQSLLQLIAASGSVTDRSVKLPCLSITDAPRFAWRGMHLDVSRHFFSKEFVKKYIDILAMHKLNVFHWHLTDDQGWRIEIKKYPRLTEIGAWREDLEAEDWTYFQNISNNPALKLYGGFYTQDDIREIVKYAQDRYITIVPEIEMPGHPNAVFAAYPELSCSGKPFCKPKTAGFEFSDPFCAGNDKVFEFLEGVLSEVIELFPSEYIHIGGDEAKHERWATCPKCQKRMKETGIKETRKLQYWFTKQIEKFVNSKGRKIIGWDEILDGDLLPGSSVMSWRGEEGGIAAARSKHLAVMTPSQFLYFDYYQDTGKTGPKSINGPTITIEMVYNYNPVPKILTPDETKYIAGVQANLWAEYIQTPEIAEIKLLPRLCALAEIAWTSPEIKNYDLFSERLQNHLRFLDVNQIRYFFSK
jgi:hexosaminidase